jgi:hypothetical protein
MSLLETRPRIIPQVYVLLSNWRFIEHSILRIIAGWGRCAGDWEDKLAVCNHVWLQAETVERMRCRADMFPGGKRDQSVAKVFADLCNSVLLAPSFHDAMAGVHAVLTPALVAAYQHYLKESHPVHDRPTSDLLHEVMAFKHQQAAWFADFSRRHPHRMSAGYESRIRAHLAELGDLLRPIELAAPFAEQCGVGTDFAMPKTPGRVKNWNTSPDVMPLIELDWSTNVEARRLYFMIGYAWEMGVAEQQLRWIYHADFMPWEFIYAESRHMWDESRHGDSGYHRLRDFGLDFEHFGYSSYKASGEGVLAPMTPREVYEAFYGVTQIAETGYFETKRYCLDDFLAGDDEASAEMMQFDIIDETSHVEYGRLWLTEMGRRAGVEEDYRSRGAAERAQTKRKAEGRRQEYQRYLRGERSAMQEISHAGDCVNSASAHNFAALTDQTTRKHYEWMLRVIREQTPLTNSSIAPVRPFLPM